MQDTSAHMVIKFLGSRIMQARMIISEDNMPVSYCDGGEKETTPNRMNILDKVVYRGMCKQKSCQIIDLGF